MNREQQRTELIEFLRTIQKPDYPLAELDDQSGLVESGLIDSLALLQIVSYLERQHGVDFTASGIDPEELRSIHSILELIERAAPS